MACGLSPSGQAPGLGHGWVTLLPSLPPHLPPVSHPTLQKRVTCTENFQPPSRGGYPWATVLGLQHAGPVPCYQDRGMQKSSGLTRRADFKSTSCSPHTCEEWHM